MPRRNSTTLITLGSEGAVAYQRLAHDDVFALVRDNEPEIAQLFAEGRYDATMFASDRHPLLSARDDEATRAWLVDRPVRRRRRRPR